MPRHINPTGDVFHEGEKIMHERAGVQERLRDLGLRMIRAHMPDQHRAFFEMLRTVHIGAIDQSGHPWAILRIGPPGFMLSPDTTTLSITSQPLAGEPDDLVLDQGAKVSVLGLEFETRRRNRLNATVKHSNGTELGLSVDQSYGNCPKYIQTRTPTKDASPAVSPVSTADHLTEAARTQISKADTLILASRAPVLDDDPRAGVDVNHRGGFPGFVTIRDNQTLEIPDYAGNNFYNSYGNILLDPRVGLQFWDFETGTLLTLTGTAEVIETATKAPPLTGRALRIHVTSMTRAPGAVPLRYALSEYSPKNPELRPTSD